MSEAAGDPLGLALLFLAAIVAGGVNAIAGGGTILTFALLAGILPPGPGRLLAANVTSKIGLWPGAAAAAWASRGSRAALPDWSRRLVVPSGIGAVLGVVLLGVLPQESFDAVVPWLILLAAVLFTLQPQVAVLGARRRPPAADNGTAKQPLAAGRLAVVCGLQLLVGIYGGYFGAAIGILMLAVLSLLGLGDVHAVNAVKNLLAAVVNGVATAVLVAAAVAGDFQVSWPHVAVLAVGSVIGGIAVAHLARRLPAAAVRRLVAIIAFVLAGYHFWLEWAGRADPPRGLSPQGTVPFQCLPVPPPAGRRMIVVTDRLTKRYGGFTALNACSLEVRPGEVFGLLGPNGAGKTTLLRLLLGYLRPTSGSATVAGHDSATRSLAVREQVAYLPGEARLFRRLTGHQVLDFFAGLRPACRRADAARVADRLGLDAGRQVARMSTGMRQKLALAVVLATDAALVILDEPTANLDPTARAEVLDLVREANAAGRTVVFSSHVLSEVEETCGRVAIMRAGAPVHEQSIAELRRGHRIRARLTGRFGGVPEELAGRVTVVADSAGADGQERLELEAAESLAPLLGWLATLPLAEVEVEPIGLAAVYDRFHRAG